MKPRIQSIDILRGAIIVIMALDHVRDFVHAAAFNFSPTDLSRTTAPIFFTRWITHLCAPVFMFTAGLGAFFWARGRPKRELSAFLLKRGLWLMLLDWTAVHLALYFDLDYRFSVVNVLWALGLSMVVLAALVHLPPRAILIVSLAAIALHNLADPVTAANFGAAAPLWNLLHQIGVFRLGGRSILIAYPLVPWFAVMSAGYCCGRLFEIDSAARRRILLRAGAALTLAFVILRAVNVYGDPARWTRRPTALFTLLSFLNCTKYPPSLLFLLMTLGPALIALALLDRVRLPAANPLIVFGRTPLFFFVVHLFAVHAAAVLLAYLRYGPAEFLLHPLPSMGGSGFPQDYGFSLAAAYAVWIAIVALLYPPCRWYAGLKARRKDLPWLSYL